MPSELAIHLAGNIRVARRRYRKRLARCQKKFSETAVHDLRVETRRVLALLDLLEALHPSISTLKLAKSFKQRLEVFGDLRDTQVQLRLLKPRWDDFPEAHGLKTFLQRREKKIIARLADEIKATRYARLNRRLKEIEKSLRARARGPVRTTGATPAAAALRKPFARVLALRRQVRPSDAATIHELRVAFKRFRYMSELLQPLLPKLTAKRLDRMKDWQDAAGEIQDLEVLLALLARVVKDRKLNPAALRNLRTELSRRRRQTIESFLARIDDLLEFQPEPHA
jgi:CHAD domain-containing protein